MTNIKARWLLPLLPLAALALVASGVATDVGTKPAMLTVSPTLTGGAGDASTPCPGGGFSTCQVTLHEPDNANSSATWFAQGITGDGSPGPETFTPSQGTIKPGQSITIKVTNMDCDNSAIWLFEGLTNKGLEVGAAVPFACG